MIAAPTKKKKMRTVKTMKWADLVAAQDANWRVEQNDRPAKRPAKRHHDKETVRLHAAGRWHEILSRVAGISDEFLVTREMPCPKCNGNTRWRCFDDYQETGGALCSHCGLGHTGTGMADGFQVVMWMLGCSFPKAVRLVGEYLNAPTSRNGWKEPATRPEAATRKPKPAPLTDEAAELRHRVYSRLGELCGLSPEHRADLRERGLSDAEIDRRGYFSAGGGVPSYKLVPMKMHWEFIDEREAIARGVPGVFPGGKTTINLWGANLMIQVRNAGGETIAIQTRPDAPNTGGKYKWFTSRVDDMDDELHPTPSTPPHTALPSIETEHIAGIVRLTEGILKADVATALSGITTVGIAGVANWRNTIDAIEATGCNRLLLAFDSDCHTNADVAKSLKEAYEHFSRPESTITVALEVWEGAKGIDDALLAGVPVRTLEGTEAAEFIAGLRTEAKEKPIEIKVPINDPERLAIENLASYRERGRDIRHWRGEWYTYKGKKWEPQSQTYILSRIRGFIESRFREDCEEATDRWNNDVDKGKFDSDEAAEKARPKKLPVTRSLAMNVADAVQTICILPDHIEQGCMLPDRSPRNVWAANNGLLDLDQLAEKAIDEIQPHTSNWFSSHCHEYDIDKQATCPEWLKFLDQVFLDRSTGVVDTESIELLQRWFGYCLMDHVNLQKMLILDGVSRSGKGVIARVLKRLVGESFTCSPKLFQLGGEFGLQPFLEKRLAVIGDAKLNRFRHDIDSILETLLGIIGQDSIDVSIKREKTKTTTDLKTKFMLLCNGIPTLNDPAMAIVNRVVILKFNNSFAGKEDIALTGKLLDEMDGIFRWALLGFCYVHDDPKLPQPESGRESLENFKRAVSPIRGFVEECCYLRDMDQQDQPEFMVHRDDLFDSWLQYCHESGRDHPGTRKGFLTQLTTAFPSVREVRPREGNERPYKLVNIELSKEGREKRDQKRDRDEK